MNKAGDYLNSINSLGIVPGLESIRRLLYELGSPHEYLKFIHIAGTNGKGSTGTFLVSILNKAGIKNGHFSSPAVFQLTETIRINGVPVSEDEYIELEQTVKVASERVYEKYGIRPTAFECETAMAFVCFYKRRVDLVILECGMGGLLDATNVIPANICSIITGISIEHTAYLGDSLTDIARHKAGIIKPRSAVFMPDSLDEEVKEVIRTVSKEKGCFTFFVKPYTDVSFNALYQYSNAGLAVDVCFYLKTSGFRIGMKHIQDGLKEFSFSGRYEKISENPDIIIDGAHNPEAVMKLNESLISDYPNKKLRFIFGAFKDKNISGMLQIIKPLIKEMVSVTVPTDRAMKSQDILKLAETQNINCIAINEPEQAVNYYLSQDDVTPIVCFGSLSYLKYIKEFVIKNG